MVGPYSGTPPLAQYEYSQGSDIRGLKARNLQDDQWISFRSHQMSSVTWESQALMSNSYEIYHILRQNNSATDSLANAGASLPQGFFSLNGAQPSLIPIP